MWKPRSNASAPARSAAGIPGAGCRRPGVAGHHHAAAGDRGLHIVSRCSHLRGSRGIRGGSRRGRPIVPAPEDEHEESDNDQRPPQGQHVPHAATLLLHRVHGRAGVHRGRRPRRFDGRSWFSRWRCRGRGGVRETLGGGSAGGLGRSRSSTGPGTGLGGLGGPGRGRPGRGRAGGRRRGSGRCRLVRLRGGTGRLSGGLAARCRLSRRSFCRLRLFGRRLFSRRLSRSGLLRGFPCRRTSSSARGSQGLALRSPRRVHRTGVVGHRSISVSGPDATMPAPGSQRPGSAPAS